MPPDYVARASAAGSASYDAWTRARPGQRFRRPCGRILERTLELSREYAGFFAPYEHIADPLIDDADEGMTTASVRSAVRRAARELVPMVRAISDSRRPTTLPARRLSPSRRSSISASAGRAPRLRLRARPARPDPPSVLHEILRRRRAHHHARSIADDIGEALFSTLHEAGHAMYEQGVARCARRHAARLRRLGRRAREPVAAVGERRRAQPRLLGAFLSGAAARPSRTSSAACRSRPSIAPSTRWSAR